LQIVEGQRNAQTLENVVSKFNVKLGGLNYTLTPIPGHDAAEYMKQDRLILGVAQASAEGKEQRTVYGYAANPKGNPNEFVGGFIIHKDVDVSGSIRIRGREIILIFGRSIWILIFKRFSISPTNLDYDLHFPPDPVKMA